MSASARAALGPAAVQRQNGRRGRRPYSLHWAARHVGLLLAVLALGARGGCATPLFSCDLRFDAAECAALVTLFQNDCVSCVDDPAVNDLDGGTTCSYWYYVAPGWQDAVQHPADPSDICSFLGITCVNDRVTIM